MDLNGIQLPPCVIGTWAWGAGQNGSRIVFGNTYAKEHLKKVFDAAYDAGFYCWDTAEVYGMGNAEEVLGNFINCKSDILISTKYHPKKKFQRGAAAKALHKSMERLGVEYVFLYWLHRPYNIKENMSEISECVKDGSIHKVGLCNCNVEQIKEAEATLKKHGLRLYAVQNHYSLLSMERQKEILEYCKSKNILFFAYMVLEQGALSGHYDEKHPLPVLSYRGFVFNKIKFKKIQKLIDYERYLAAKYNVDTSQIPIVWAVAKGVIPIVGLTKRSHADALAKGISLKLQPKEILNLEKLALESGVVCKGTWE